MSLWTNSGIPTSGFRNRGDFEFESYDIVHESNKVSFGWCFIIYREFWKYTYFCCYFFGYFGHECDLNRERASVDIFWIINMIWNVNIFLPSTEVEWVDEMSCRKGVWKFDTLWEHPLGKGEATCHLIHSHHCQIRIPIKYPQKNVHVPDHIHDQKISKEAHVFQNTR